MFAYNVGGKKPSTKGRDTEIDYENVTLPLNGDSCNSEAIPVEKLKWYTKSNADLITRQYEVGWHSGAYITTRDSQQIPNCSPKHMRITPK